MFWALYNINHSLRDNPGVIYQFQITPLTPTVKCYVIFWISFITTLRDAKCFLYILKHNLSGKTFELIASHSLTGPCCQSEQSLEIRSMFKTIHGDKRFTYKLWSWYMHADTYPIYLWLLIKIIWQYFSRKYSAFI